MPANIIQHGRMTVRREGAMPTGSCARCRRKFLRFFPEGFHDEKYLAWERNYKWNAHQQWEEQLSRDEFRALLKAENYAEAASRAVRIESRTNLLFSFEKMALRDAVKSPAERACLPREYTPCFSGLAARSTSLSAGARRWESCRAARRGC